MIRDMKKLILLLLLFIGCQNISDEIIVDRDVEDMYLRYNKAWSDGDFETITNEIYSVPFSLYLQDSTVILNSSEDIKNFLIMTFNELETNNYGYSIRNSWTIVYSTISQTLCKNHIIHSCRNKTSTTSEH